MQCVNCLKEVPHDSNDAINIEHDILCGLTCEKEYKIKADNTIEAIARCIDKTITKQLNSIR